MTCLNRHSDKVNFSGRFTPKKYKRRRSFRHHEFGLNVASSPPPLCSLTALTQAALPPIIPGQIDICCRYILVTHLCPPSHATCSVWEKTMVSASLRRPLWTIFGLESFRLGRSGEGGDQESFPFFEGRYNLMGHFF